MTRDEQRKNDDGQEKIINQFVLKYFFNKVFNEVEYANDYQRQVVGIDVIADGQLIDIKAQSSKDYLNHPRNTFILELYFINKAEQESFGWFIDPEKTTDMYAFVWIPKTDVINGKIPDPESIEEIEIMLVDKTRIKTFINKTRRDNELFLEAWRMKNTGEAHRDFPIKGLHFAHSHKYPEKPTNLVAQKWFLKQFSLGHYIVTKNSITKIE